MDNIDLKILHILLADGRIRTVELAERVGLSPTPCARRVKALEDSGIITGYRAIVDQTKLGYPITVFVTVELERKNAEEMTQFETAVLAFSEIRQGYIITGSQDYILTVSAADLPSFERFLKTKLSTIPGIRSTRSRFALRSIIPEGRLPP